jgi:uncharacterized protein (TIGR03437 family)
MAELSPTASPEPTAARPPDRPFQSRPVQRSVTIGGVAARDIPFFASAPGFLESILQINLVIPARVSSSPYNPLVISASGMKSADWTTIAVR